MVKVEFECGNVVDISNERVLRAIHKKWGLYCDECREEEDFKFPELVRFRSQ